MDYVRKSCKKAASSNDCKTITATAPTCSDITSTIPGYFIFLFLEGEGIGQRAST